MVSHVCFHSFPNLLYELVFMQQQQFSNAVLLLQHQGKVLDGPDGQFILQSQNNILEKGKSQPIILFWTQVLF